MRLELNGQDVTTIARNVRTEEEIGQRRTAEFDLTYEDGVVFDQSSADDFQLADSSPFLLADGAHFKLASGGGDPENYMPVVISHPDRTFRDVALSLEPWLYWPLDEGRGLATADDLTLAKRTQLDPSAANRDGTWSTTPGAVILRRLEAESAAVPYGAAPRFEAGAAPGVTGPPTAGLGVEIAISLFVRIDVAATGSSSVLTARSGSRGMDIVRERVGAASQRVTWRVASNTAEAVIPSGRWVWIVCLRTATSLMLLVDGLLAQHVSHSSAARVDAAVTTVDLAEGTLDAEVDEVAVWDRSLSSAEVVQLTESVTGWRAFGGEVYGRDVQPEKTARLFTMPCVGRSMRIDRSELIGAFATAINAPAGDVAREALRRIDWKGTTYGCDLDTLIGRIVARGGSGADFLDRLRRLAEAIWWPDGWDDVHLDRAGATRHLDVTLTEDVISSWNPTDIMEHHRTRTVARGAGISGGFKTDTFVGDGITTKWETVEQVRKPIALYVDGIETSVGGGSPWSAVDSGFFLETTGAPPGVGIKVEFEYELQVPLVAVAEDAVQIDGRAGVIVRTIEDETIDTAEGIQQLARVEQAAHGQPGIKVEAELHPRATPLFVGVGGSPLVKLRGITQRMVVQRLVTEWASAGSLVIQTVTLRANDLSSQLDYYRQAQRVRYPSPAPEPVTVDPHVVSNIGQRLPQPLGGDYSTVESSTVWMDVPGYVEVPLNWAHFTEVTLQCSFMSNLFHESGVIGNRTARVRLRDMTRGTTLGNEITVIGSGPQLYTIPGVVGPAGGGLSRLRLQHRQVDASVGTWGGELDVGI